MTRLYNDGMASLVPCGLTEVARASKIQNVTEFSYVTLNEGVNVFDESAAAKTYQNVLETALKQPGARRVYTGVEVENPSTLWLFLDWETLEDHENYPKTADHGSIIEYLKPIVNFSKSINKHVTLTPFPPEDVLNKDCSPVTEVLLAFFPSDYDVASRATATRRLEEFTGVALKTSRDWRGISYGWSVENDVPIRGEEGKTGSMLAAFIGWPSVEAHQKFRETDDFKENIGLLREIPGLVKLAAFHVSCVSKEAEGLSERDAEKAHEHSHDHGGGCC